MSMTPKQKVNATARAVFGDDTGCGDSGCVYGSGGGMGTNGGCQCLKERDVYRLRHHMQQLSLIAKHLAAELALAETVSAVRRSTSTRHMADVRAGVKLPSLPHPTARTRVRRERSPSMPRAAANVVLAMSALLGAIVLAAQCWAVT